MLVNRNCRRAGTTIVKQFSSGKQKKTKSPKQNALYAVKHGVRFSFQINLFDCCHKGENRQSQSAELCFVFGNNVAFGV